MSKISTASGDTESTSQRLDRMRNVPLGQMNAEDVNHVVQNVVLNHDRDVQTIVDVARFGSSI